MDDPSVALPGGADPAERTRELRRAHAAFTRDGRVEAPVRAVIARSWRRCARARVSPECARGWNWRRRSFGRTARSTRWPG